MKTRVFWLVMTAAILASGLIVFLWTNMDDDDGMMIGSVESDRALLEGHVSILCGTTLPRNVGNISGLEEAAFYIREQMRNYGYKTVDQEFEAEGQVFRNVICYYGPEDAPRLVIGAHYDVCDDLPGADDNASGVAGLLELARLVQLHQPQLPYRLEFVAYTNEEPPFFRTRYMGSAVHASELKKHKVPVKGMICLEMIGYFSDKKKSQEYPIGLLKLFYPTVGNFIAVVGKMGQGAFTGKIRKAIKQGSTVPVESINAPEDLPGIDFSDHLNYWALGYDAVMITDTSFYRNRNYHKATDTPDTLDYDRMAEVVNGVYHAIVSL